MKVYLKDKINIYSTNGNLIRTLCAFAVIFHHSFYLSQNDYDPLFKLTNGQIGIGGFAVAIFFFYSGLYVTKSLMNKKNHKSFIMSRCKRIFPQLWIVILATTFIIGPIFTTFNLSNYFTNIETYKYLLNCFLIPVHNLPGVFENNIYGSTVNGALWTLPVEFLCYISLLLISVFINKLFKKEQVYKTLLSLALICSILLLATCEFLDMQIFKSAFSATSFFFLGSLYYLFKEKITLSILLCVMSTFGVIASFFTPVANYLLIIFLPYTISFLSLYPKQLKTKTNVFNFSYEIYLIGFPIQQIIVNIFGGSMSILVNFLISLTVQILLLLIITSAEKIKKLIL